MNQIVGTHHILFITLDTLRFDVAQGEFEAGNLPQLSRWLPSIGWQARHTPGNFTYAAHHAFFSGFLPTPIAPGPHPRLLAAEFQGSETSDENTCVFKQANWVEGLANRGYQTHCIGGVGFFNRQNAIGNVLPSMFSQSYWTPELGVTCPESTENQVRLALRILDSADTTAFQLLFINVSAIHQPNCHYLVDHTNDSLATHGAALRYVDRSLAPLIDRIEQTKPWFVMICSDHGTCYGEAGFVGHRLNHDVVGTVPYMDCVVD